MQFFRTKIKKQNIAPVGFAIGYLLIFFNPIGLTNEVYPYYVIPLLLMYRNKILLLSICLVVVFAGAIGQFVLEIERYIIDSMILAMGGAGIFMLNALSVEQLKKIATIFRWNIVLIFLIFLLIRAVPALQDALGNIFSGRGTNYEFLFNRNGSIAGIAPEPAYASLHVLTMFLFLLRAKESNLLIEVMLIGILLQTKSIYGIFFYLLLHILYPRRATWTLSCVGSLILAFYSDFLLDNFGRVYKAITELAELRSLVKLENSFGSERFTNVVNGIAFYGSEYITGFSLPVIFIQQFGFLALFIGLFLVLILPKFDYIRVLLTLFLTGPALLISGSVLKLGRVNK